MDTKSILKSDKLAHKQAIRDRKEAEKEQRRMWREHRKAMNSLRDAMFSPDVFAHIPGIKY